MISLSQHKPSQKGHCVEHKQCFTARYWQSSIMPSGAHLQTCSTHIQCFDQVNNHHINDILITYWIHDSVCLSHYFSGFHNTQHACSPHERTGQWEHSGTSLDVLPANSQNRRLTDKLMGGRTDRQKMRSMCLQTDRGLVVVLFLVLMFCMMCCFWIIPSVSSELKQKVKLMDG